MADNIRYDPLSKFAGLGPDVLARIDRNEFPSQVSAPLAATIAALEQRYGCLLIAYYRTSANSEHQLFRYAEAAGLSSDGILDVRRTEIEFSV